MGLTILFSALTCAFVLIAVAAAAAERWPITVAAAALTAWMGSLAWSTLRKTRR